MQCSKMRPHQLMGNWSHSAPRKLMWFPRQLVKRQYVFQFQQPTQYCLGKKKTEKEKSKLEVKTE